MLFRSTQAQLDQNKLQQRRSNSGFGTCTGDGPLIYQTITQSGPAVLKASVDELLSVPRPPVSDPCL